MRSRRTGKAVERNGSTVIVAPSSNSRMIDLAGRRPGRGPCGMPSIVSEHEPQIPSRQSLSKAIGRLPSATSRSLRTSSISRNEASASIPRPRSARSGRPPRRLLAPDLERQSSLVAPGHGLDLLELELLGRAARARRPRPSTPRPGRSRSARRRGSASPSSVWCSSRRWQPHDSSRTARRGTSARRARGSRRSGWRTRASG